MKDGDHVNCFSCGKPLTGLIHTMIHSSGFEWTLVHGEGRCSSCHWPARAHHFIKVDGHGDVTIHNLPLLYHPDYVERRMAEVVSEIKDEGDVG